jgi:hypothetical protein
LHWYSTFNHITTKGYWDFYAGPEVACLTLLCYVPITYVLASASTSTSVGSLLVNILATSGPYYFLQRKPLTIQPPRRQSLDWNGWWLRWIYSATAAVVYSFVIHKAAVKWVLPQIREYFPLARHALRDSDLNWKWLLCSIPFLSIAVWNLFRVPNLPRHRTAKNIKDEGREGRIYWLEDLRVLKRISVILVLSSVLTWVQLKAKSEVLGWKSGDRVSLMLNFGFVPLLVGW